WRHLVRLAGCLASRSPPAGEGVGAREAGGGAREADSDHSCPASSPTRRSSDLHDLGHPPFGHAGEEALNQAMAGHGGFRHDAQSLRIVGVLERRRARDGTYEEGLNLTWEVRNGIGGAPAPPRRAEIGSAHV